MVRRLGALVAALVLYAATPAHAVVGGQTAPTTGYGAVANITIAGTEGCTGTLIAPQWVLTAAHCASAASGLGLPLAYPGSAFRVVLGTINADGSGGEAHQPDRVVINPKYFFTQSYDISLLHLAEPSAQKPVPIATAGEEAAWAVGTKLQVAGFGLTAEGAQDGPKEMQIGVVPRVEDTTCKATYPQTFESGTQLCAGYQTGGVDSCNGDSGGPLFGRDAADQLRLVGVTSYGDGCAEPDRYGVYGRIADPTLREWVRGIAPDGVDSQPAVKPPDPGLDVAFAVDKPRQKTATKSGIRFRLKCTVECKATVALRKGTKSLRTVKIGAAAGVKVTGKLKVPASAVKSKLTIRALVTTSAGVQKTVSKSVSLKK